MGSVLGPSKTTGGLAVDQSLELLIWLSLAAIALSAAYILLWRTRRVLTQSRPDTLEQEVRLALHAVPRLPAVFTPPAVLASSAVTESTSSVRAW